MYLQSHIYLHYTLLCNSRVIALEIVHRVYSAIFFLIRAVALCVRHGAPQGRGLRKIKFSVQPLPYAEQGSSAYVTFLETVSSIPSSSALGFFELPAPPRVFEEAGRLNHQVMKRPNDRNNPRRGGARFFRNQRVSPPLDTKNVGSYTAPHTLTPNPRLNY